MSEGSPGASRTRCDSQIFRYIVRGFIFVRPSVAGLGPSRRRLRRRGGRPVQNSLTIRAKCIFARAAAKDQIYNDCEAHKRELCRETLLAVGPSFPPVPLLPGTL